MDTELREHGGDVGRIWQPRKAGQRTGLDGGSLHIAAWGFLLVTRYSPLFFRDLLPHFAGRRFAIGVGAVSNCSGEALSFSIVMVKSGMPVSLVELHLKVENLPST